MFVRGNRSWEHSQAAAWPEHKADCNEEKRPYIEVRLSRDRVALWEEFVARKTNGACFHHEDPDGTILSLFLDKGNPNRIFDSLSDRPVHIIKPLNPMTTVPEEPMDLVDDDAEE